MKKLLIIITSIVIASNVSFAAWWNPFTWKIFNRQKVEIQTPLVRAEDNNIAVEVSTAPTTTESNTDKKELSSQEEITALKKEVENLKKQNTQKVATKQTNSVEAKTSIATTQNIVAQTNGNKTVTLPNGAIAEVDVNGNFVRLVQSAISQPTFQTNTQDQPKDVDSLKIITLDIKPKIQSFSADWQTNIPSQSKLFLKKSNGETKIYESESGLSTRHTVNVNGIDDTNLLSYEIEAVYQSQFSKRSGTFKMDYSRPTSIDIQRIDNYTGATVPGGGCSQVTFVGRVKDQYDSLMRDLTVTIVNPETGETKSTSLSYKPSEENTTQIVKFYLGDPYGSFLLYDSSEVKLGHSCN